MSNDTSVLTSERVTEIFWDCHLIDLNDPKGEPIEVRGIVHNGYFLPGRLEMHRQEIHDMLAELPETFMMDIGGGDSFVNACIDKRGNPWTDLHETQEQLMLLGIAIGEVRYTRPRVEWDTMPGGIPYIVVML